MDLPSGMHAEVDPSRWSTPAIFRWLQRTGAVPDSAMLRTFNMGVGLIIACAPENADVLVGALAASGEPGAVTIGEIRAGGEGVRYR